MTEWEKARRYQVGDRVRIVNLHTNTNPDLPRGTEGTVVGYWGSCISVRWDPVLRHAHTCDGKCEKTHGWNVYASEVELTGVNANIDVGEYL